MRGDSDVHNFQEYTYKKITPCDVCSQVLRGKTVLFIIKYRDILQNGDKIALWCGRYSDKYQERDL